MDATRTAKATSLPNGQQVDLGPTHGGLQPMSPKSQKRTLQDSLDHLIGTANKRVGDGG